MDTKRLGDLGEQAAADYLLSRGYKISARKFRVPVGEIDLIAEKASVVVFVEVKTRRTVRCGTPAQSVDYRKQQKIIRTACWYIRQRHLDERLCRFDVIEVYCTPGGSFSVRHIENAFEVS